MENGRGDRFRYDEEGQLVEAWYNATDPANSGAGNTRYDGFNYDALGNRRGWGSVANKGWMNFLRRDNGLNQYAGWENNYSDPAQHWGSGVFYDDNFNQDWQFPGNGVTMADGWMVASYNSLNQPIVMGSFATYPTGNWVWFGYDPLGRCVKRTVGPTAESGTATYFYYEGWNLIQEGPSSTTASRNYVHGARVDEIVKQITPGNMWERYFHYDARGHCTLQTDAGGGIVEQYEYDAFGQPYFYDSGGTSLGYSPWGNRFLFTGREYLSDLKLYDFRNRMYQPELGRFMQPDPKEFGAGDYNLYRYCHNDPVNKSDPLGLWPPETHEEIIDKSLGTKLSDSERNILKDESKNVDKDQSQGGSYKHGMRHPSQSVAAARAAHQKYIADNLKQAIGLEKAGKHSEALRALGRGMHALSDSTSPTHEGYQPWYGLPDLKTQSSLEAGARAELAGIHYAGEKFGQPTQERLDASITLIRNYYDSFVSGLR